MTVQLEARLTDSLTQVVAAGPAHRARSAAGVVLGYHPVPDSEPAAVGVWAERSHLAGPFVPDDEGQRRRPCAAVVTSHDLHVGAADPAGQDAAQDLTGPGLRYWYSLNGQLTEPPQHRGVHLGGHGARCHRDDPAGAALTPSPA